MKTLLKFALVAAAGLLATTATAPAMAQSPNAPPMMTYGPYQWPGGHYESLAAYTRSVEGTPCGMNCTRDAQQRWSNYYYSVR
jgi:hypothetical protein